MIAILTLTSEPNPLFLLFFELGICFPHQFSLSTLDQKLNIYDKILPKRLNSCFSWALYSYLKQDIQMLQMLTPSVVLWRIVLVNSALFHLICCLIFLNLELLTSFWIALLWARSFNHVICFFSYLLYEDSRLDVEV